MYPILSRCQPDPGVQPEKPTPARVLSGYRVPYSGAQINSFWVRRPIKGGNFLDSRENDWGIGRRKNEWCTDTGDSGFGMERTHSTGLARASWVPGNLEKRGNCGVDASKPRPGVNDWARIRRLRPCSPILETQPSGLSTRRVQLDLSGTTMSPIVLETGTLDNIAQAHHVLETEKMVPPIPSNPEPSTSPICSFYKYSSPQV